MILAMIFKECAECAMKSGLVFIRGSASHVIALIHIYNSDFSTIQPLPPKVQERYLVLQVKPAGNCTVRPLLRNQARLGAKSYQSPVLPNSTM